MNTIKLILGFFLIAMFIESLLGYFSLDYNPIIATILILIISFIAFNVYALLFYRSDKFIYTKNDIDIFIRNCNELNSHIEDLKGSFLDIKSYDFGNSKLYDNSTFNFSRKEWNKHQNNRFVHNCSALICKNANNQPFKFLCKYFDIKVNEITLSNFENVLNDFSAAEQGKTLLKNQRDDILLNLKGAIPFLIYNLDKRRLVKKLGFDEIDFSDLYFPTFIFQYISAGGNSSAVCEIKLDIENLNKLIYYFSSLINFKNSIAGQRALMTSQLREKIKQRDNFTCQICSISIYEEANLLLEIDHVFPLSKGGITSEDNLQTLCWKCNRNKGSKTGIV